MAEWDNLGMGVDTSLTFLTWYIYGTHTAGELQGVGGGKATQR